MGHKWRNDSVIVHLKNFNNWIKSVLISKFVRRGDHVLDLACGSGGDLLKWKSGEVSYVLGADIAAVRIEQARKRYEQRRHRFDADFVAVDCFSEELQKYTGNKKFDLVSIQFSFHYAFESEQRARSAFNNISRNLIRGGYFIGTIPNCNWLIKKLRNSESLSFGNSIYSVNFDTKTETIFGHKYRFVLHDAINDCPEYIVHQPTLIQLAKEYNLELVFITPFHQFFEQEWKQNFDLFQRMNVCTRDVEFPDDDWEAIGIYSVFAFKKIR